MALVRMRLKVMKMRRRALRRLIYVLSLTGGPSQRSVNVWRANIFISLRVTTDSLSSLDADAAKEQMIAMAY